MKNHTERTLETLSFQLDSLCAKWENLRKRKAELELEQNAIENSIEDTARTLRYLQDGIKLNTPEATA